MGEGKFAVVVVEAKNEGGSLPVGRLVVEIMCETWQSWGAGDEVLISSF